MMDTIKRIHQGCKEADENAGLYILILYFLFI